MTVDRDKAVRLRHHGRTVYFCSEHCRSRFEADAGRPEEVHAH
jgi:YHS domain-containing protein